jgi:hypothetical protein
VSDDTTEIGWPASLPDPQHVEMRAAVMFGLAQRGLQDMADPSLDSYRIIGGFFAVAVFGRSVTLALQHLRTFDLDGVFDAWYTPWTEEMRKDELCKFFYKLRSALLKDIAPMPGVVMASVHVKGATGPLSFTFDPAKGGGFAGYPDAIPRGPVQLEESYPKPRFHRGKSVEGVDLRELSRLYVAYLDELLQSARPVIASIQARWRAEHPWQTTQGH